MRRKQVELHDEHHAMGKITEDLKLKKEHQKRFKRRKLLANVIKISFVLVLFLGLYAFDASPYSRVRTLKISGNTSFTDAEIREKLKLDQGDRIYLTHGFIKEQRGKKIDGIESVDVNVLYTKGYVSVAIKETPLVAYQTEPEFKVFYADGSSQIIDESKSHLTLGLPLLVGYTDETVDKKMLKGLSELDFESVSAISEIHINPQSYDPLAMKLYMSEKYLVYVSIETLPMMYMYATLLSGADEGKKCIELFEYGPDNETVIANIRACAENEY